MTARRHGRGMRTRTHARTGHVARAAAPLISLFPLFPLHCTALHTAGAPPPSCRSACRSPSTTWHAWHRRSHQHHNNHIIPQETAAPAEPDEAPAWTSGVRAGLSRPARAGGNARHTGTPGGEARSGGSTGRRRAGRRDQDPARRGAARSPQQRRGAARRDETLREREDQRVAERGAAQTLPRCRSRRD